MHLRFGWYGTVLIPPWTTSSLNMKPVFILYLALIFAAAIIFAAVYASFQELVERNPATFSIALVIVLLVGMYGMMDNIISHTSHKIQEYE